MSDRDQKHQDQHLPAPEEVGRSMSQEELAAEQAGDLPEREAMSLVNANLAIPINAAVAANVLSDGATAYADATQDAAMDQST